MQVDFLLSTCIDCTSVSLSFLERNERKLYFIAKKHTRPHGPENESGEIKSLGCTQWSHTTPSKVIILNKINWANIKGPNLASHHFDTIRTMIRGVCCNDPGLCHRCKPFPLLLALGCEGNAPTHFARSSWVRVHCLGKMVSASLAPWVQSPKTTVTQF